MSKQDTVTASGASGRGYQFDVYAWDDLDVPKGAILSPVGAVYLVLRKGAQNNYDVLYVGQTCNLTGRFEGHHKQACFDRNARTHIGVHRCNTERDRLVIETDLVRKYTPTCNA